ncbi:MAG: FHA domain-containing protein [Pseudomonadales bacterium]
MGFVVEITSRSGRVMERYKATGASVSVGRGYDNDVIVADPYVDVRHAVIEETSAGLTVRACGTNTPVHAGHQIVGEEPWPIHSGAGITLGRTHLKVYDLRHPVAPVQAFDRVEQFFASATLPGNIGIGLVAFLAIGLIDMVLRSYTEVEISAVLQEIIASIGITLLWAVFWSVVARISRGEPRFFHHWLAAAAAVTLYTLGRFLLDVVGFNTGSSATVEVLSFLLEGGCLAFALTLNLRFALRQTTPVRHAWAQGVAWVFVAYIVMTSWSFDDLFSAYPDYEATLLPDDWRVVPSISADAFVARSGHLYEFPAEELKTD